jgi:glycosyltransferase involved in cell wall biosynthesis
MRVLVISHAAVLPANQVLFAHMEQAPDVELALVAPAHWNASVGGDTAFRRHEALKAHVITRPVVFSGKVNLHSYRGLKLRDLPWTPDVVLADEETFGLAGYQASRLARACGAALVVHTNQNLVKRYPPPFCWTERAVYRQAAAVIACSQECADVLRAKGYTGPTEVIGFPVDPEVSRPWPTEELRGRLGIPAGGFVVGFMGRLAAEKGAADLLAACHLLDGALPSAPEPAYTLLMVGQGAQEDELRARAAHLTRGRAVFAGTVPHGKPAAEHLSCMDVCVVPSRTRPNWKEQFGRVIIEAMACGVPVVGSDSGNVPLLVRAGGGRVFPEGNAEALADHLLALVQDPAGCRALGEAARAFVLRQYTLQHIAEQTVQVLRAAAERR